GPVPQGQREAQRTGQVPHLHDRAGDQGAERDEDPCLRLHGQPRFVRARRCAVPQAGERRAERPGAGAERLQRHLRGAWLRRAVPHRRQLDGGRPQEEPEGRGVLPALGERVVATAPLWAPLWALGPMPPRRPLPTLPLTRPRPPGGRSGGVGMAAAGGAAGPAVDAGRRELPRPLAAALFLVHALFAVTVVGGLGLLLTASAYDALDGGVLALTAYAAAPGVLGWWLARRT